MRKSQDEDKDPRAEGGSRGEFVDTDEEECWEMNVQRACLHDGAALAGFVAGRLPVLSRAGPGRGHCL